METPCRRAIRNPSKAHGEQNLPGSRCRCAFDGGFRRHVSRSTPDDDVRIGEDAVKVIELKRAMDEQFARVAEQFTRVDEQFARVDEQFARVGEQFARVDEQFVRVDERFAAVDARFLEVEARITIEGETTRRHFDVVAEQMHADIRLVLERVSAVGDDVSRLRASVAKDVVGIESAVQDHELRLRSLER